MVVDEASSLLEIGPFWSHATPSSWMDSDLLKNIFLNFKTKFKYFLSSTPPVPCTPCRSSSRRSPARPGSRQCPGPCVRRSLGSQGAYPRAVGSHDEHVRGSPRGEVPVRVLSLHAVVRRLELRLALESLDQTERLKQKLI